MVKKLLTYFYVLIFLFSHRSLLGLVFVEFLDFQMEYDLRCMFLLALNFCHSLALDPLHFGKREGDIALPTRS